MLDWVSSPRAVAIAWRICSILSEFASKTEDIEVADNEVNEDALSENNIENENDDLKSDANTTDPKPYKCDLCNFASEKAYCIENHKVNKHPLNCCYGCPGNFPSKTQCRKHHQQVHSNN